MARYGVVRRVYGRAKAPRMFSRGLPVIKSTSGPTPDQTLTRLLINALRYEIITMR